MPQVTGAAEPGLGVSSPIYTSPILSQRYPTYPEPAELSNYTHVVEFYVGDLCNNIGLVLVCLPSGSTDVTPSPSQYMIQLSILSPVLFIHVGDPYILPL